MTIHNFLKSVDIATHLQAVVLWYSILSYFHLSSSVVFYGNKNTFESLHWVCSILMFFKNLGPLEKENIYVVGLKK